MSMNDKDSKEQTKRYESAPLFIQIYICECLRMALYVFTARYMYTNICKERYDEKIEKREVSCYQLMRGPSIAASNE